jgi:hypothetical protein
MFDKLLHHKLLTEGLEADGALAKGGQGGQGGHHDRGTGPR